MNLKQNIEKLMNILGNNPDLIEKMETVEMAEESIETASEAQIDAAVAEQASVTGEETSSDWSLEDKIDFLLNKEFEREDLAAAKAEAKAKKEQEAKDKQLEDALAKVEALEKSKAEAEAKAKEAAEKPQTLKFNPEETVAQSPQKAPGFPGMNANSLKNFDQTDAFFAHLVPGAQSNEELGKA